MQVCSGNNKRETDLFTKLEFNKLVSIMKYMKQLSMTLETIRKCLIMKVVQIQQVVTEVKNHETICTHTKKNLVEFYLIGSTRK